MNHIIADHLRANPNATDEQVVAALGQPTRTLRTGEVTATGLGHIWGHAAYKAFRQKITQAIAAGDPDAIAVMDYLLSKGIAPTDTETQTNIAGFVQAGLITQAQADQFLYVETPAKYPDCTTAEVALTRAQLAALDQVEQMRTDIEQATTIEQVTAIIGDLA